MYLCYQNSAMMESNRNITHLELNGKHEYFGSPAALYMAHSVAELGISQGALNNYFCKLDDDAEQIYRNKKCIIRKGPLYVKEKPKKK